jgi:hypothetical protein
MADRETIRRRIAALGDRFEALGLEHIRQYKSLDICLECIQAECPHSETTKYLNYSHFVVDCTDCGMRINKPKER